jgi:hypothetical protein
MKIISGLYRNYWSWKTGYGLEITGLQRSSPAIHPAKQEDSPIAFNL